MAPICARAGRIETSNANVDIARRKTWIRCRGERFIGCILPRRRRDPTSFGRRLRPARDRLWQQLYAGTVPRGSRVAARAVRVLLLLGVEGGLALLDLRLGLLAVEPL